MSKARELANTAELNDPGFVEEKEQAVAQKIQAKLDEPMRASVSVL